MSFFETVEEFSLFCAAPGGSAPAAWASPGEDRVIFGRTGVAKYPHGGGRPRGGGTVRSPLERPSRDFFRNFLGGKNHCITFSLPKNLNISFKDIGICLNLKRKKKENYYLPMLKY